MNLRFRPNCRGYASLSISGMSVVGLTLIALALATPARAATWNVYNGDVTSLYAAATGAVSGDTVYIHGGATYYLTSSGGALTPKNSGVTYTGDGDSTVIDGGWVVGGAQPAHAGISITTANIHDITIENLKVQNCYQPGIFVASMSPATSLVSGITISHCHTYMTHDSGIQVGGSIRDPDVNHPELYPVQDVLVDHCLVEMACYAGFNECISVMDGVSYSTISHCTVTSPPAPLPGGPGTGSGGEGIDVKVAAQYIDVCGNDVDGLNKSAILIDANEHSTGLMHIRVYGNKIYDNAGDSSGVTVDSEWYNDGYSASPLQDVQVYNNLIYNNTGAAGIYLNDYDGATETHNNIWVVNNTIYDNNNGFPGINNADAPATNLYILNNIVERTGHSGNWAINLNDGGANNATAVDYNVVDDGGWLGIQTAPNTHNVHSYDPGFVNASGANFQLNNPYGHGVDPGNYPHSGIDLSGMYTDFNGSPRPTSGRWDVGAYQYEPSLPNGTYRISPKSATSKGLDCVNFQYTDNTNVQLYAYAPDPNKEWTVYQNSNGTYTIVTAGNASEGLDCQNIQSADGTNIQLYHNLGSPQQQWVLIPVGGGYYKIATPLDPFLTQVLDCAGGGTGNNTNIDLYHYTGGAGQQWEFLTP